MPTSASCSTMRGVEMIPACIACIANVTLAAGMVFGNSRLVLASLAAMAIAIMWTVAAIGIDAVRNRLADAELASLRAREHEVRVMRQHKSFEMFT